MCPLLHTICTLWDTLPVCCRDVLTGVVCPLLLTDFASGAVLFSLLAGYWPSLASKRRLLRLGTSNGGAVRQGDYLDNAEVVSKFKQVQSRDGDNKDNAGVVSDSRKRAKPASASAVQ